MLAASMFNHYFWHRKMTQSIINIGKRGRGRPRTHATPISVRVPPADLVELDRWISSQDDPTLTRPEALRRLTKRAIQSQEIDG